MRALGFLLAALAFALLLTSVPAYAWCTLPPPAVAASAPPVQLAFAAPSCMPSVVGVVGSGRGYLQRDYPAIPGATANGGRAWGWWCQAPDQTWRTQTVACLDRYCPGNAVKAVAAALAAPAPLAALQAALDAYSVGITDWVETHDYNCLHKRMAADLQATKPMDGAAPLVWRVGASGASLYTVANGTRGALISARRAPANALCDCTAFRVNLTAAGLTATYCAIAGGPDTECALCRQVPQ